MDAKYSPFFIFLLHSSSSCSCVLFVVLESLFVVILILYTLRSFSYLLSGHSRRVDCKTAFVTYNAGFKSLIKEALNIGRSSQ